MPRPKTKPTASLIERLLGEASWLLSHAQALADYGRPEEAAVERARAAACEEQVACLLEAAGREREAAIHRVSGAACHEQLGQYTRRVTLLGAALAADLPDNCRAGVEQQRRRCLGRVPRELRKAAPGGRVRPSSAVPKRTG
jgi:hypothetical protein